MSYVLNDPAAFADESTEGFVAAHGALVRRVNGGVARRAATPAGQVAVVIGGGSGHYPAFAGLVGHGLAHAAAMGNVFSSPSSQQVLAVARSVATSAGVLLSYGNYAGDMLNFDLAEERLRAEGIPCRTVRVTDDIASAGRDEREKRRGIAGDLVVFKAAGWAAEQGRDLDGVAELAARANDRTRSLGVAFSGCTLPGAAEPLFTVPSGQMALGMGIHGEPGIDILPMPTARELGDLLVERLLQEVPDGIEQITGARVGLILNGLGSVKSEELFVVYATVAERLAVSGLAIIEPEVGEYATSFEMAGMSLTLVWLDEELEEAWRAAAYSPAYRKGAVEARDEEDAVEAVAQDEVALVPAASAEAAQAGRLAAAAIYAIRDVVEREVDELGRLDAIAGDGDHGIGMQRGVRAASAAAGQAVAAGAGAGSVLALAGDAWADKAGGTSGALWGAGLRAAGLRLGDGEAPGRTVVAAAVDDARAAVQNFGKAQVGDKTLVDALVPFVQTLQRQVAETGLADAWQQAATAASDAAKATADLLPRIGRARPHMERSIGTPDPGAVSLAMAMTAVAGVLREAAQQREESDKENRS
jgi:dihydroxyacetone kinase